MTHKLDETQKDRYRLEKTPPAAFSQMIRRYQWHEQGVFRSSPSRRFEWSKWEWPHCSIIFIPTSKRPNVQERTLSCPNSTLAPPSRRSLDIFGFRVRGELFLVSTLKSSSQSSACSASALVVFHRVPRYWVSLDGRVHSLNKEGNMPRGILGR